VGEGRAEVKYVVQLPPEYTHQRAYPLLVILPNSGERPSSVLERWRKSAGDNGFILAAVDWDPAGTGYGYSESEHANVTKVIKDIKRSYQVDSDRVMLFGLVEGGKFAFDLGTAQPDLFAGVMTMGAGPNLYPARCWRNAQYLPFHCINGSLGGESAGQLKEQFDKWILRGFPALWVSYKGRGQEWFGGEVLNLCDWMSRQTRSLPLHQLGTDGFGGQFGKEFTSLRAEGNRFYWISLDEVQPRCVPANLKRVNVTQPATMTASIDPDTNDMLIKTSGVKKLSVWVVRTPKGQHNINIEKPVTIKVGFRAAVVNRRVTPSLAVLLEDLYQRCDRQQLVVGRIEVTP
jgi:hypothetical protein